MANKLTCANCVYFFGDGDVFGNGDCPYCHFSDEDRAFGELPPCEIEDEPMKYTVRYEGVLFHGDSDGWNHYETNSHDEAFTIANNYPDVVYVDDNEYGVTYHNGEWY